MNNKVIKVFIVDDSQVSRELLAHIIEKDPELKVMGFAKSGIEALHWLNTHTPDVITMDIHMPFINGFEVTRKIMETRPVPVVIVTSAYDPKNAEVAFQAIDAGALAILGKPTGFGDRNYAEKEKEIINTIKTIAGIKLIKKRDLSKKSDIQIPLLLESNIPEIKAIGIGASLGGPPAIAEILSHLPSPFPVPIFIVQHIASGFVDGFIKWLQERCRLPVQLGRNNEVALPNRVYIAPDHFHMEVTKGNVIYLDSSPVQIPQPAVGRLFHSMAYTYGQHAIGVILTGMGRDGAQDLLLMKQKGAYTIAQDEKSCVMFGMPREAIEIGAVKRVLSLDKIAQALIYLVSNSQRPQNPSNFYQF